MVKRTIRLWIEIPVIFLKSKILKFKTHSPLYFIWASKIRFRSNYFLPHELSTLTFFSNKLSIMTLVLIKLPSYSTFSHFVSQRDNQQREKFLFSIFALTLNHKNDTYILIKWGQKWKQNFFSPLIVHLTNKRRESVIRW